MLSPERPVINRPPADPPAAPTAPVAARRQPDRQLGDRVRSLSLSQLPERKSYLGSLALWIVALAVLAGAGYYAYSKIGAVLPGGHSGEAAGPSAPSPPRVAETPRQAGDSSSPVAPRASGGSAVSSTLTPPPGEIALESKGYIVPAHQILVSPKVNGMIVRLNIEEGRRVAKGEILAVLESTDYEAEVARAKANARLMRERLRELENGNRPEEIKQAEAELREAEAQLVQLEAEYKRSEELRRRNSVTQQDYELAQSKFLAQKQRVQKLQFAFKLMELGPRIERIEVAKAEVAESEADVIKAEWRLGNCTIRAPISGTILKKNAEEGNIVNPIAFNGSFSLCEMADLSDLEVDLAIQERDIAVVQVGQKCRVRAEVYPNRLYEGYVDRLMPIADRAKGAVPVRVKVRVPPEEEGVYLKPEMGAIVTFLNQRVPPAATAEQPPMTEAAVAETLPVSTAP